MTAYMRWLAAERGLRFDDYAAALALVGRASSRTSGRRSGTTSRSAPAAPDARSSARARCPAPSGSRAPSSTTPSTSSAAATTSEVAILHASELRELGELSWGELREPRRRASRRACATWASSAATASSPTCPTSPRPLIAFLATRLASARSGRAARRTSAPRSVVDRFAQIEPKVLFAVDGYRYGGKDFDRRDVVAGLAGGDAEPRADRRPPLPRPPTPTSRRFERRDALGRAAALGAGAELELRARPLRPSALGPLLLGHHRPAEGDRPGPRRHPARAPEEAPPPRRHPARATASSGSRRPAG